MKQEISFLESLVLKGGPDKSDYAALDQTIKNLAKAQNYVNQNEFKQAINDTMQASFSTATMQGFAFHKPHGYAGDFEIIERIYDNYICQRNDLKKWDIYWQSHPAAHAVRNRKSYFKNLIAKVDSTCSQARVLNVASGPARDLIEYLTCHPESELTFDCVDQDAKAIKFAKSRCLPFAEKVNFHRENIFNFQTEKQYELVWSAGLFDYFDDKTFTAMTKKLLEFVKPGGKLVVGNFCDSNPSKDYMELFDWKLHHRSKTKLLRLALLANAAQHQVNIESEAAGVNLFLNIAKPL